MIDLYTAATPNGHKVSIALEELGLPYRMQVLSFDKDTRLGAAEFLAGDYSIADIATYPWVSVHDWVGVSVEGLVNLQRWIDTIGTRPAVQRGMEMPKREVDSGTQMQTAQSMLTR